MTARLTFVACPTWIAALVSFAGCRLAPEPDVHRATVGIDEGRG
jgi:hypothetical protein